MKTWRERIVEAGVRGRFTSEDKRLANHWTTCAIGEQHAILPMVVKFTYSDYPGPQDETLFHLGSGIRNEGFEDAVRCNAYRRAEKILDAIEDRVLELKRRAHDV